MAQAPLRRPMAPQAKPTAKAPPPKPAPKPAPAPSKAVATRPAVTAPARRPSAAPSALVVQDSTPDFMRQDHKGTKFDRSDLEIPRLKLLQALSPELQEYKDARAGMLLHTASGTLLPADGVRVVPLYVDKRYVLWRPRQSGGGILARADDGVHWTPANKRFEVKLDKKDGGANVEWTTARTVAESGLAEWGSMNPDDPDSPPAATLMYNYVLAFPDLPDLLPAILTFSRSSLKVGKRLNTKISGVRAPMYGMVFELTTALDRNNDGEEYWNLNLQGAGWIGDKAQYEQYKALADGFEASGVQIKDIEDVQNDAYEAAPADDSEDPSGGARY